MPTSACTRRRFGFTLVELMVVIAIIGVLASTVTLVLRERVIRAKQTRARADIRSLTDAIEIYAADEALGNGRNPDSLETLVDAGLLRALPLDPWKNEYVYERQGPTGYTITTYGADGVSGGSGEDEDISS